MSAKWRWYPRLAGGFMAVLTIWSPDAMPWWWRLLGVAWIVAAVWSLSSSISVFTRERLPVDISDCAVLRPPTPEGGNEE